MKATGGRVRLAFSIPVVVLTTIGARSGERRDIPLPTSQTATMSF